MFPKKSMSEKKPSGGGMMPDPSSMDRASRHKTSVDTERKMLGKPSKFGSSIPDDLDSPNDGADAAGGGPGGSPAGGAPMGGPPMPPDAGAPPDPNAPPDGGLPEPGTFGDKASAMQAAMGAGADPTVAQHHGVIADLTARVQALEAELKAKGGEKTGMEAMKPSDNDGDEDY